MPRQLVVVAEPLARVSRLFQPTLELQKFERDPLFPAPRFLVPSP